MVKNASKKELSEELRDFCKIEAATPTLLDTGVVERLGKANSSMRLTSQRSLFTENRRKFTASGHKKT